MSRAHRRLLRQTNQTTGHIRRQSTYSWTRSRIMSCDCERRAAAFWGERALVLPPHCLWRTYTGPLKGVKKVRLGFWLVRHTRR